MLASPPPSKGQSSSLSAGIIALEAMDEVAAAVVLLGDEPGVTPGAILRVVEVWRSSGADAVRSRYADRTGHPVLLARTVFAAARRLRGDRGAGSLLERPDLLIREVRFPTAAPIDIDTPEDYARATGKDRSEPS